MSRHSSPRSISKHTNHFLLSSRQRVNATLETFKGNPHAPELRNHALHDKLKGRRSISAGGNLRIVFECVDAETIRFFDVGTHNQVY